MNSDINLTTTHKSQKVAIVAAKRTAIGNFLGSLSAMSAPQLGALVIKQLIADTNIDPKEIDEVITGQVLTAGVGQNPARQGAMGAGVPIHVPALTINQVCGSSLKAVHLAAQAISLKQANIVIAGGQESMSQAPHLLYGMRAGVKMGDSKLVDGMIYDGLTDVYNKYHMGVTAENIASKYAITKDAQDAFALYSQQKASQATKNGRFKEEIVPIILKQKKGDAICFAQDEFIRHDATLEGLQKLKPAFQKDNGSVTAGNSSGINDGAAFVMLMSEEMVKKYALTPLAYIEAYASTGLEPELMGLGPVYATNKTLAIANWAINDLDLVEANEAFAAQAIAVNQLLHLDTAKVNVNGGAIALGHPIGASGCRILVSLVHEMQKRNSKKGLATLCVGGGMGVATLLSRP